MEHSELPKAVGPQIKTAIIVPYMPKGGVGKTTTTAHLGYALSEFGKTLVIDSDPQGNLTNHLINESVFEKYDSTLFNYLKRKKTLDDSLIEARPPNATYQGLYLLGTPSNDVDLQSYIQSEFPNNPVSLKLLLKEAKAMNFSFILFDPPASFSFYTRNLILSATHVIPVIELEKFGFEALFSLLTELNDIKIGFDVDFDNTIAIINKYDKKTATHQHYLQKMEKSPFSSFFVINHSKSIPYAAVLHMLLQEYKAENQINSVFYNIAVHFNKLLRPENNQN